MLADAPRLKQKTQKKKTEEEEANDILGSFQSKLG